MIFFFAKVKIIFKKLIADKTIIMYCDSNTFSTVFSQLFFYRRIVDLLCLVSAVVQSKSVRHIDRSTLF